jgi:hypothetical protein
MTESYSFLDFRLKCECLSFTHFEEATFPVFLIVRRRIILAKTKTRRFMQNHGILFDRGYE